jgi:hypothetical protein
MKCACNGGKCDGVCRETNLNRNGVKCRQAIGSDPKPKRKARDTRFGDRLNIGRRG